VTPEISNSLSKLALDLIFLHGSEDGEGGIALLLEVPAEI